MTARYLILGAGRFGRLALARLVQKEPQAEFCLVDHDLRKLIFPLPPGDVAIRRVAGPATAYMAKALEARTPPDWLIPAIPRHVAFEWLWQRRPPGSHWRQEPVPLIVGRDLPFKQRGAEGELYLSVSTERCPDDCPEPADRCYLTGLKREFSLYRYLEDLSLQGFTSLVVRSRQLAPGVGGYRPAALWDLWRRTLAAAGSLLISTACRCHGVVHGLHKVNGR
ncbi:MAG: hypothetical protein FJ135_01510 [Deltaproteobacteria bacterium]|nr:hypothetical protein [Deltaproteobacteria bacterium]